MTVKTTLKQRIEDDAEREVGLAYRLHRVRSAADQASVTKPNW